MCNYVCPASPAHSETSEAVIAGKMDTATASLVKKMHHMLSIMTLTLIHGHTDFNDKNNKCLIILETVQAMPINFALILKITDYKI